MPDLHELSALQLADLVRSRQVSPGEVTEHFLRRAEALDATIGAFVTRTPERAIAQAKALESLLESSPAEPGPALAGVPCPVKDLDQVAGVRWTLGSAAFADQVATVDDGVVTRLAAAGTVMTGKTNTPELGLPCYTEPDVAPVARSPWDLTRSAGGSSGGAAAVVAAGIAPVALGSDGGGSIRIPASACGIVGLKTSRGRIAPGPHGVDVSGLAGHGALARTVTDAAALLDVLCTPTDSDVQEAGVLARQPTTFVQATTRAAAEGVRPLRVGLLLEPVIVPDADIAVPCRDAAVQTAALLADLGHHVTEAPVPFEPEDWASFRDLWGVLAASAPVPAEAEKRLRPLTRWLRAAGAEVSATRYVAALAAAQLVSRQAARRWAGLDVVLSPTLAQLPAPVGSLRDDADPAADFAAQMRFTPWTSVWNLLGRPSISLPLGWVERVAGAGDLPVGVMLGGPVGGEALLLGLSATLEEARPWSHRRPPVW